LGDHLSEFFQTWNGHPEKKVMLESGRVSLQSVSCFPIEMSMLNVPVGQDFFLPQAHRSPVAMYFMRFITHDWPVEECIKILKQLHAAASPDTLLMINEQVVPYACPTPPDLVYEGAWSMEAPSPLLANLGESMAEVYLVDFGMTALFGSQERTLEEFKEMTEQAGWRIDRVYQTIGSCISQIVCSKL
jgi:hypothetical protein